MKKYIFLLTVYTLQASDFQELRKQTLLKVLPAELITELRGFSAQQIFQEIQSAKNYEEALQKVRELADSPVNHAFFNNPQSLEKVFLALGQKNSLEGKRIQAKDIAKDLGIPAVNQWLAIFPLEKQLEAAIRKPDLNKVKYLIDNGLSIESRIAPCLKTPLQWAVEFAILNKETYLPIVHYFLEKGADVNAQDCLGDTALIMAVNEGNKELTQLLVDKSANPLLQNLKGQDAYSYAKLLTGAAKLLRILKQGEKNASISQRLFRAVKINDLESIKNLIEKEPASINVQDAQGNTP